MDNFLLKKNKKIAMSQIQKKETWFLNMANELLVDLNERTRQIMQKRFGLSVNQCETLEKIGQQYGITRERIRQVILGTFKNISTKLNSSRFKEAEKKIIFTINQNNGIIKEIDIIKKLNLDGKKEANAIKFFAVCSPKIIKIEQKGQIEKSWITSYDIVPDVKKIILNAKNIFEKEKRPLSDKEICRKVIFSNPNFSESQIISFLKVASALKKSQFGKWGKTNWKEITPKGTKEKVYLILKERKHSLHFTQITKLIDKYKLGKKKAHPQTVHNELIKDDRFILIGRGIYALREWGYFEGTVKEVLRKILEKSQKPLDKNEIIEEVLKIRKVKKTTVMVNLNNSEVFHKQRNLYTVKK